MYPTITKPTRICYTTATLLDNLIVSAGLYDKYDSQILICDISDHLHCILTLHDRILERKGPLQIICRKLDENNLS